jgi:hypothetical protein
LIFENNHRRGDNDPSHVAYIVPNNRSDDANGDRSASGAGSGQSSNSNRGSARGSFGNGRGIRQSEPLPGDAPGTERFEVTGDATEPTEDQIPF